MSSLTTLCYIERDGKYLMMHRNKKENDVNEGKWIGVGGHFEANESPDECLLREVKEETGLELMDYSCKGIVTFVSAKGVTEYMFLYHSNDFIGELKDCDEGELEWIDKSRLFDLELCEGCWDSGKYRPVERMMLGDVPKCGIEHGCGKKRRSVTK